MRGKVITVEMAADVVRAARSDVSKMSLFVFFEEYFWVRPSFRLQERFARLCGLDEVVEDDFPLGVGWVFPDVGGEDGCG